MLVVGRRFCNKAGKPERRRWRSDVLLGCSLLQAVAGHQQVRLGHPEDVVDGSGRQDLPHGLRDDVCRLGCPHLHGAQEANDEELMKDGVWMAKASEYNRHLSNTTPSLNSFLNSFLLGDGRLLNQFHHCIPEKTFPFFFCIISLSFRRLMIKKTYQKKNMHV